MLTALLVIFQVASVAEVASPRPDGWVTDQANVISADAEAKLDAIASDLHALRGIELAVVTVDQVPGTPKQFATALFNHWGLGAAATNTGVLVLLVMSQRRLEVEIGDGIEGALPSVWLAEMQRSTMVPRFKAKDFGGGLVAGVSAMAERIKAAGGEGAIEQAPHEYRDDGTVVTPPTAGSGAPDNAGPPISPRTPPSRLIQTDDDAGTPTGTLVGGGLAGLGLGGGGALLLRHRRRRRRCLTCQPNRKMLPLSEIEDDAHLDAGQIAEERVGSIDYEVLVCPGCQVTRTLRHGRWFSGFGRCSSCSYKTAKSSSTTLVHATYDHGGQVEVTEVCTHCSHRHTSVRHTARRTRPSTSSSSTRSSYSSSSSSSSRSSGFGGGRSSGGGAGSGW